MSGWTIQQAIYDAITGDAGVSALCDRVVDFGPREDDASSIYPYIAFGSFILAEDDTDTTTGFDAALRMHTYSDQGGSKECRQIQDALYDALHLADLSVTGYQSVLIYREDTQVMQTSRGAFHGVCEYRALLRKT